MAGNWEILLPILSGLIGALIHFRKTGRLPLGRLPFRALRRGWHELSSNYFTSPRPTGVTALLMQGDLTEIEKKLRNDHFESGDMYSFEYDGEVLNMRRASDFIERDGEIIALELHLRLFETENNGYLCLAHDEASRLEEWGAHIRETDFSWDRGTDLMETACDDAHILYTRIESEDAVGVKVTS